MFVGLLKYDLSKSEEKKNLYYNKEIDPQLTLEDTTAKSRKNENH